MSKSNTKSKDTEKKKKKTTPKKGAKGGAKTGAKKSTGKRAASKPKKTMAKKTAKTKKKASFSDEMAERLREEKEKILHVVADKMKKGSNSSQFEIGDIYDIASSERERELSLTLGDRDRDKLARIEDALERIEEGSYEECDECGEPIEQGRLRALPFTRLCVECQSRTEREQRIRGKVEEEPGISGAVDRSETGDEDY